MSKYEIRRWILDRLSEKSTWRGLASLVGLFGVVVAPDQLELIGAGIVAVIGIIEMGRKED